MRLLKEHLCFLCFFVAEFLSCFLLRRVIFLAFQLLRIRVRSNTFGLLAFKLLVLLESRSVNSTVNCRFRQSRTQNACGVVRLEVIFFGDDRQIA